MGTIPTRPWDAAAYLRTEKDFITYLNAALAESDPQLMVAALNDVARAQGNAIVAADTLLASEGTHSSPGSDFGTVLKALDELGLRLHVAPASRT